MPQRPCPALQHLASTITEDNLSLRLIQVMQGQRGGAKIEIKRRYRILHYLDDLD